MIHIIILLELSHTALAIGNLEHTFKDHLFKPISMAKDGIAPGFADVVD